MHRRDTPLGMGGASAPDGQAPSLTFAIARQVGAIDAAAWDACAAADGGSFLSHAYLSAVESSGLAAPATGWTPLHLTAWTASNQLVAVAPAYLKSHSDDEFWCDRSWALGYAQAGGRYYPKLLIGVPFVPVSGRRLLLHPSAPPGTARAMIRQLEGLARDNGWSSIHATFADDADGARLEDAGWLPRHGIQYEWTNAGYRDFGDFLGVLTSRKRGLIQHERRAVAASGIRFRDVAGSQLRDADVAEFLRLLDDLHHRRGTRQPLTAAYFHRLAEQFGDRVTFSFALKDGTPVGALLHVIGTDRMHVRNWGCLPGYPFLHFELCYYRRIEQAIAQGCGTIEGGYGGVHKLARGFLPKVTRSLHWFSHANLRDAVADDLARERAEVSAAFAEQRALSPFRREEKQPR